MEFPNGFRDGFKNTQGPISVGAVAAIASTDFEKD